jgi:glycosyltransferase involved in cell wall biosynthesis
MQRRNILVLSPHVPRPDIASGDRRFAAILGLLAERHRVDLFCPWERPTPEVVDRYGPMLRRAGVRVLHLGEWRPVERAALRRLYDIVLFEFWNLARNDVGLFRRLQPWAKVVIDTVDVHFLREESALALGHLDERTVAANKQDELRVYREADAVVVITAEERQVLEACGGMPPLYLIPNMLPTRERPERTRRREALFIGGFNHAPNADGLFWFTRAIWPAVRAAVPDARLTVVGNNPTQEVLALGGVAGIEVVGYVPETGTYLDRAAVSVAPLRFGAGMKGKVTEAMASALPVVTTSVGAQGLNATPAEHLIVADEPEAFARGVAELLLDPPRAERIGRAGQALVASICSPGVVERRLEELLAGVGAARPVTPPPWWLGEALRYHGGDLVRQTRRVPGVQCAWRSLKARLAGGSEEI